MTFTPEAHDKSDGHPLRRSTDGPSYTLFRGLPTALARQLEQLMQIHDFEPGATLFAPEHVNDRVWFVVSGSVRLWRRGYDGKELTVALLDEGATFGEGAVLGPTPSDGYAEAVGHVRVGSLSSSQMKDLLHRFPTIGANLVGLLAERLSEAQAMAERIAYWSLPRRVARLLLELERRYGHPTLDGNRIINRTFTKGEVGTMVGATREVVTRLISQWQRDQIVTSRGRRIVLVDIDTLRRVATGGTTGSGEAAAS